jgi:hypothetical protein
VLVLVTILFCSSPLILSFVLFTMRHGVVKRLFAIRHGDSEEIDALRVLFFLFHMTKMFHQQESNQCFQYDNKILSPQR